MKRLKDIPYVKQLLYFNCGPACLEMALRFHGVNKSQYKIGSEIKKIPFFGYKDEELKDYATSLGLKAELDKNSTIEKIAMNIDENAPTIVLQKVKICPDTPHFRIVIGYDSFTTGHRFIITHDPILGEGLYIPEGLFDYLWNIGGQRRALTIRKKL